MLATIAGFVMAGSVHATALQFSGDGDRVSAALPIVFDDLAANSFTLTFDVRVDGVSPQNRLFFAQKNASNFVSILLAPSGVYFYVTSNGSTTSLAGGTLTVGQWSHVSASWNGATSQIALIIDGTPISANGGSSSTSTDGTFVLGAKADGTQPANAALDEFAIWPAVLTGDQLAEVAAGQCPNLLAAALHYDFEVGTPGGNNAGLTMLPDISGNGNDGTLMGFALSGESSNWVDSPYGHLSCLKTVPQTLVAGQAESNYGPVVFTTTGGSVPYFYEISGALPTGVSLSSDGTLGGTPTTAGTFEFTLVTTDSSTGLGAPFTASQAYTLEIAAPSITLSPLTLPDGIAGNIYVAQTFVASGGIGPYSFAVTSGIIPDGESLSPSGLIAGTPTHAGDYAFTITATDANSFSGGMVYNITIDKGDQTITFPAQTPPRQALVVDGTFAIAPPASGGASGNPVTYSSLTTTVCTVTDSAVRMLEAGTCTIAADQAGDGDYNAGAEVTQSIAIGMASQTITFGPAPAIAVGGSGAVTATTTATPSPNYPITFTTESTDCSVTSAGLVSGITAGSNNCVIVASQAGDANVSAASATLNLSIDSASSTLSLNSSANPSTQNVAVTFIATISAGAAPTNFAKALGVPTGSVVFADNGAPLATVAVDGASNATYTTAALSPGAHVILATYSGDANTQASTGMLTQTVAAVVTPPAQKIVPAPLLSNWLLMLLGILFIGAVAANAQRGRRRTPN